ncbi:PspC domain-containing protein [Marinihelvus fidelis]|nr:PspC domain-containing protein [Marinihelvus fidelis]
MATDDFLQSVRDNLNGRPGQPLLFGVCKTLAGRMGQEPWVLRAIAIVLLVFLTLPTVIAYIVLALVLDETSERTQGAFKGLFITLREAADRLADTARNLFGQAH